MTTLPSTALAVTSPFDDTAASVELLDDHDMVRPVITLSFASRSVAVSCLVPPPVIAGLTGVIVTFATGVFRVFTEIVACACFPSAVATMSEDPTRIPVTTFAR